MKKKKSVLSLVLSMAVVISMLPAGALAAEGDETPVCTCETVCTEGNVNTDCPVCGLEDADLSQCRGTAELASPSNATALSVEDVQKLINALPTVEELKAMDTEEQGTVYTDLQTAYDAYEALTDEEKQEVTGAELFEALFAVFNGMTNVLADSAFNITGGTANTDYTYSNGLLTVKSGANLTISMADGAPPHQRPHRS